MTPEEQLSQALEGCDTESKLVYVSDTPLKGQVALFFKLILKNSRLPEAPILILDNDFEKNLHKFVVRKVLVALGKPAVQKLYQDSKASISKYLYDIRWSNEWGGLLQANYAPSYILNRQPEAYLDFLHVLQTAHSLSNEPLHPRYFSRT